MGYLHNGVKTGGVPIGFIKRFVDAYDIKIFIETGTAGGQSAQDAAQIFETVHTIEIVEGRSNVWCPENVSFYIGDSAKLLKNISSPFKGQRIVYWLDAHWSEPYEAPEEVAECPLLDEIASIKGHDALVLIDDARLFFGAHPHPGDPRKWPKFQQVFAYLRESFPKHEITIVDDYIVAIPDYMTDTFHTEWRERFKQRYPEEIDKIKANAKFVYDHFMNFIK